MSTRQVRPGRYVVRCDRCDALSVTERPTARLAIEAAREIEGWERVPIDDRCPECQEKLSSMV